MEHLALRGKLLLYKQGSKFCYKVGFGYAWYLMLVEGEPEMAVFFPN